MKRLVVILCGCMVIGSVQARMGLFGLERLKDKVDQAIKSAPTVTINDFFTIGKKQSNAVGECEKTWAGFYWAKQQVFCTQLKEKADKNKNDAITFLRITLNTKYANQRNPFLTFVHDLHEEEKGLPEFTTKILRAMEDCQKASPRDDETFKQLRTLFDETNKGLIVVKSLADIVDKLF